MDSEEFPRLLFEHEFHHGDYMPVGVLLRVLRSIPADDKARAVIQIVPSRRTSRLEIVVVSKT